MKRRNKSFKIKEAAEEIKGQLSFRRNQELITIEDLSKESNPEEECDGKIFHEC